MLIIKRKYGESITIGNDITITIARAGSHAVHLAIDAPRSVPVMRTEVPIALLDNTHAILEALEAALPILQEYEYAEVSAKVKAAIENTRTELTARFGIEVKP